MEYSNQALSLTVNDLAGKLAEAIMTKNLMAVQLTASQEETERLRARVEELEALLEEETQPAQETIPLDEEG